MEFYQEFLVTAAISVLFFLLLGKLAALGDGSAASSETAAAPPAAATAPRNEKRVRFAEITEESADTSGSDRGEEIVVVDEGGGSLLHGEDEWEGIERSELEERFRVAADYVKGEGGGDAVARLSGEVQMRLHALHKVATEGPCYETQPPSLKGSGRAKWHAWQTLGNMTPEAVMEQYIALLAHSIPEWMGKKPGVDTVREEGNDPLEERVLSMQGQLHSQCEGSDRLPKNSSFVEGDTSADGPKFSDQGLGKRAFLNLLSPTTMRFLSFY